MNGSEIISAIEKFFFDIIGAIIPAVILLVGVSGVLHLNNLVEVKVLTSILHFSPWLVIVLLFVLGHLLLSFSNIAILTPIKLLAKNYMCIKRPLEIIFGKSLFAETNIYQDPLYKIFIKHRLLSSPDYIKEYEEIKIYNYWRNIILSQYPQEKQIIYKYTFLSLFCLGVCSSIIVIMIAWLILPIYNPNIKVPLTWNLFCILTFSALLFIRRYFYFNRISISAPFSFPFIDPKYPVSNDYTGKILTVYLAGGYRSGWQSRVTCILKSFDFINPKDNNITDPVAYTEWDINAINNSSIILANMESSNPGGYALALEVGYAKAKGKFVIWVDDFANNSPEKSKYLDMCRASANVSFKSIDEAIVFLKNYTR